MARLRYNGLATTLGAALSAADTAITFATPLTHSGGTAVPTLSGTDYIPLTILDASGAVSEIVSLTAYTSGATTGTIARAQESTAATSHSSGAAVVHSFTVQDASEIAAGTSGMVPTAKTTDYTLTLSDAGKVIELTAATALVLTVPPDSAVAFPVGTIINVYQGGAGNVSIAQGAGVTIRNLAPLSGQYAEASLRKRATDEWVLTGDTTLAAAPALKDYAEVQRTAGSVTLNQTAITPVHTSLDLTIAAAAGDLVTYGITGLLAAAAVDVCFDVYTMPSGTLVNPFSVGLTAGGSGAQGVPGWEFVAENAVGRLAGEASRVLTSGDVSGGLTTLRLCYSKSTTTARTLFAATTIPLKVWAKNHGPV